jgi:NAD(P)-dependent dehydrogenase (short-subunit alcohol dehydrogenase family)
MQPAHLKIFITGATSGVGRALAAHYLERGAAVGACARRTNLLEDLSGRFPEQVHCYALDVRDAAALNAAARDFMAKAGVPDIVIANAGVSTGTLTEHAEDVGDFQQVIDINVLGVVKTFHPFVGPMKAAKKGALVGIASVAGFRGLPGSEAYSASKAALISYLESLRVELRDDGIKVVTICPGYVKTPMTGRNPYPMPFILEAAEAARRIARAVKRGKSLAVIPWQMALFGRLFRWMPNWLYDWMFNRVAHKPRGLI